jgi:hypothetical protein
MAARYNMTTGVLLVSTEGLRLTTASAAMQCVLADVALVFKLQRILYKLASTQC